MTLYRGYEIIPAEGGFAALDEHDQLVARGKTEEAVMDAIDAWKRKARQAEPK